MPRRSTLAKVPLAPRHFNLRFGSLWSRGWESNPLQPSIPGCLLRVATRCFCSPSPEPIGLRWTVPTPASCPRQFGPSSSEPYKLVENRRVSHDYQSISFHTSRAICLAVSSEVTFPINSLPVLKTDTL